MHEEFVYFDLLRKEPGMTKFVRFGESRDGGLGFAFRSARLAPRLPEISTKAACDAARSAIQAFDDGAARGDPFAHLSELSELEHRAVMTACATKATTPAGVAEKALLLERIAAAGNPNKATLESFALSLASDAVALARTIATSESRRN
jgi:hypothetical protein